MIRLLTNWPFEIWPWIFNLALAVVALGIAIVVSVHVLLHKRDVGSAIGWIGLTWLSPVLGGLLYQIFGINRVRRRAHRLREDRRLAARRQGQDRLARPDHRFAPLERAASRITGRPSRATRCKCSATATRPIRRCSPR